MAKEKKIVYKVEVNTDDASKGLDTLDKSAQKSSSGLSKLAGGFTKLTASLGIIGLLTTLWGVLSKNQKIMDAVNVVMGTISIVFNQVGTAVGNALDKFKGLNLSFESTKKVLGDLFTIALTPLKLWFLGMKSIILGTQLIWEKSFLGGNDEGKIKELETKLGDVKDEVIDLKDELVDAGKSIKDNVGDAIDEIGTAATESFKLTKEVVTDVVSNVSIASIKAANAMAEILVQSRKNLEALEIEQEALMLNSQQQAEMQRQVRDDVSKTTEERLAANTKLGEILDEQFKSEQALLNKKIAIAKMEVAADKDNHEKKMALKRLEEVETAELLERITGQRSEQLVNEIGIIKEASDIHKKQVEDDAKILADIYRKSEEGKLAIQKNADIESVNNSTLSEEEKVAALLEIEKNYQSDLKVIEDKARADKEAQDEADLIKKEELRLAELEKTQENIDQAQEVNNYLADMNNAILDNRLMKVDKAYTKEKKMLDNKLKLGLISQEEYDKQLIDLDNKKLAEQNAAKKKAFDTNKALSLAQIAIDTASAIVATWKQWGSVPAPGGPIAAALQAAAIVGIAGVQASTIAGTQYTAATGGMIQGDLHAQSSGGVRLSSNLMAEGGEFIVNRASTEQYKPLLDAVNNAGNGNGDSSNVGDVIDYDRLAAAINDKKVYIVSSEITDQQDKDKVIITNSQF